MTDQSQVALHRKIILAFAILFTANVVLDQITKIHAERTFLKYAHKEDLKIYQGSSMPIFNLGSIEKRQPGFGFGFTYVRNQGAAWGLLNNLDDKYRIPFFYIVTIFAIVMIGFFFKSTPPKARLARFALVLVLSGAIGNFLDRLRLGYVIDWIDVRWNIFGWYYDFPKFNIADSCISIGIAFLIIDMLFLEKRRTQ